MQQARRVRQNPKVRERLGGGGEDKRQEAKGCERETELMGAMLIAVVFCLPGGLAGGATVGMDWMRKPSAQAGRKSH
jgi:hypothetical protein